jgi:hypothetical protein
MPVLMGINIEKADNKRLKLLNFQDDKEVDLFALE